MYRPASLRCILVLAGALAASSVAAQHQPAPGFPGQQPGHGPPQPGHGRPQPGHGLPPGHDPTVGSEPGTVMPPRSPTGWYTGAEMEQALQAAETLGQPMVLMFTDPASTCPKCRAQTQQWMRARELGAFVRVLISTKDPAQPPLFQKLSREAGERAGRFIPRLYLGTSTGELLGVVPYRTERPQYLNAVGAALKQFGGVVPPDQMMGLWRRLGQARQLWSEGKIAPALRGYQEVKRAESLNPNLAIFQELKNDEPQILQKGEEELEAVRQLLAEGDQRRTRAALANIRRQYAGFQTADDAKELQEAKPGEAAAGAPETETDDPDGLRSWTDATGKHRIEAELVAVKEGWVRLRRASGDLVSVPIARLSEPDQQYVAQWQRD